MIQKQIMPKRFRSVVVWIIAAVLISVGAIGYYRSSVADGIRTYEASRDRAFIIDIFKKNWYWLISDYSPDYNIEFMLDRRSPTTVNKSDVGKLIINTMVIAGKPAGFVIYYEIESKLAQLLFLAVGEKYRGKGYARKLTSYAISDIKNRGLLGIRMNTRADNVRARKLYESIGFKQIWTDGAYVLYKFTF